MKYMGIIVNPIPFHFHPFGFESLTNVANGAAAISFILPFIWKEHVFTLKQTTGCQGNRLHETRMLLIPFIFIIVFILYGRLFIFGVMNM